MCGGNGFALVGWVVDGIGERRKVCFAGSEDDFELWRWFVRRFCSMPFDDSSLNAKTVGLVLGLSPGLGLG